MIPSISNIKKAIYCLNKRIDLLEGGHYLDTMVQLSNKVKSLESLISDDINPTTAIDKFNEIVDFLNLILNTDTLKGFLDSIHEDIATINSELFKINSELYGHLGHGYVDLGLPSGTLWATMNVGANSETDYGNYYLYGKGAAQYAATSGDSDYSGTENPLAASADTAVQVWGGPWHMPTKTQMQELTANTTYQWVTNYKGSGINGGTFTATNGAVLFLPAAGYWIIGSQRDVGYSGNYWSSFPYSRSNAAYLSFGKSSKYVDSSIREVGYSVRPVMDSLPSNFVKRNEIGVKVASLNNGKVPASLLSQANWNLKKTTAADFIKNKPNVVELSINITYSELKTKRDGGTLKPGQWYRITNYVTTTVLAETLSANHAFDIIVRADETNKLNENAFVALHSGDTYFLNCKLNAWELKYCLDNDTDRFAWADTTNGKGVIYWMKDEFDNECPYDFKNIQFKRYKITACPNSPDLVDQYSVSGIDGITVDTQEPYWCYTFSMIDFIANDGAHDVSAEQEKYINDEGVYKKTRDNIIRPYYNSVDIPTLPDNVFVTDTILCSVEDDYSYGEFYGYYNNTFGSYCNDNTLGNYCSNNTFGNYCSNNTFGSDSSNNTFGNYCDNNTFGGYCNDNTFGNSCNKNTFGKNYTQYVIVENGNKCIILTSTATTSYENCLQNITIAQGVNNSDTPKTISHNTVNDTFQTVYRATNSQEVLV